MKAHGGSGAIAPLIGHLVVVNTLVWWSFEELSSPLCVIFPAVVKRCCCHASRTSLTSFKQTVFDYRHYHLCICVTSHPGLLLAKRESDVGGTVMWKLHCVRLNVRALLLQLDMEGLSSLSLFCG